MMVRLFWGALIALALITANHVMCRGYAVGFDFQDGKFYCHPSRSNEEK
ncbi:hypothetical protein GCM10023155_10950 [Bremerella cremea]